MPRFARSLAQRTGEAEQMDDFTVGGDRFARALRELRQVNRFLGGYAALHAAIDPLLRSWSGGPLEVLDLGAGLGDHAVELLKWGRLRDVDVRVTALDANPAAVGCAGSYVDRHVASSDRSSVRLVVADALDTHFPDASFHLVTASLFLHHFDDDTVAALLRDMARMASVGIVANDLHRHPLAYAGIRAISTLLPVSPMFRHDGPLSVRRAFTPEELGQLARAAGLADVLIRRHWAFRLTLSTIPPTAHPSP